jgi:hypothetical protein
MAAKQSKSKLAAKNPAAQPEIEYPETPVEIAQIRERITRIVGNKAVQMVRTTIGDVEKGHYLGMKYLFEMVGIYPAAVSEERGPQDSLVNILLRDLGISEETSLRGMGLQTKVTEDSSPPVNEDRGHDVK